MHVEHQPADDFALRHIGPSSPDEEWMLASLGYASRQELLLAAMPAPIRSATGLALPDPASEQQAAAELRGIAAKNVVTSCMIGLGYHACITPPVIRRNVLENPAWYTAYTPYQPEIAQGRLEALLNFQTMVADLTGLPTANASLLDEGTAAAEAISVMRRAAESGSIRVVVDADCPPQTLAVVTTRAEAVGIEILVCDLTLGLPDDDFFGVLLQYPGTTGAVRNFGPIVWEAHERGALVSVAADLLSLVLLSPPGEWGADIVVGSSQRFGVPLSFGGPHAAYMAVRDGLARQMPGRLVGVSLDRAGNPAYRLALQTREQHIRREKATSNICTAQVLLAIMAGMYAVYHGPDGLRRIANSVHAHAAGLAGELQRRGHRIVHEHYFDTLLVTATGCAAGVVAKAEAAGVTMRLVDADHVGVSCSEATTQADIDVVVAAFGQVSGASRVERIESPAIPAALARTSDFLTHPVFHRHRSETAMLRYLRRLSDRDYALDRGMIPLGSCTMKLNSTTEMEPITWPAFSDIHPFAPASHSLGYQALINDVESWLALATGYDKVSIQPNAGSQGELAGLLAIRAYHRASGDADRDVCLIPASAHGTNAASAVMAGMRVAVVNSLDDGTVDLTHLRQRCEEFSTELAAIMVTYPSTHGVYEQGITDLCDIVHQHGGQVYVDGANLNALLGLAKPGEFGGDVSHLNLHKTFCIPHGGGGPGVGPVAVRAHLAPHLPTHPLHTDPARREGTGPISAAPFGSAAILPITWAYIRMMGADGLVHATEAAVLSANYIAARLDPYFPVLYRGHQGLVAHECILDLRPLTKRSGITVDDVAKCLIDYGFHAPTMSFPVPGTFMVEPTESEDLVELDRFCNAMISIHAEVERVVSGEWPSDDNPLRLSPHTAAAMTGSWGRAYDRRVAVFPDGRLQDKYWPQVERIDQAAGDRNLVCTCPSVHELAE